MVNDSFDNVFKDVNRVLVVMPHPDDCELFCGGTVARLIESGKEVRVIKMTSGEKGCKQEKIDPEELKRIREEEDRNGMKILGVSEDNNIYLDLGDGVLEADMKTIGIVAREIRTFKPDLIITTNAEDVIIRYDKDINWVNHRDHINTGKAVIYASYPYARDISFFPEQLKDGSITSHSCTKFLIADSYNHPDKVLIDVTNQIDKRIKAHASHSSQYSLKKAEDSADFFTSKSEYTGKRYEEFRYVLVD
jgi:LmbE family N-acetylglucosaminyl deacetylase